MCTSRWFNWTIGKVKRMAPVARTGARTSWRPGVLELERRIVPAGSMGSLLSHGQILLAPATPSSTKVIFGAAVHSQNVAITGNPPEALTGEPVVVQTNAKTTSGVSYTYQWTLTAPAGSKAVLRDAGAARPTFTPDVAGTYQIRVMVTDVQTKQFVSASASVLATHLTLGASPQNALTGSPVTLTSSANADPKNSMTLKYQWTLTAPAGSKATLNDATSRAPSLVPDIPGNYVVGLQVTDALGNKVVSPPLTVTALIGTTVSIKNQYSPAATSPGYWLVSSDGGIFAFGEAQYFGSTAGVRLAQPIVGMASTPRGRGYWLVSRNGDVLPFGDAQSFGTAAGLRLNRPIVGMAATPDGRGYWLVASDGGVFAFGDAQFKGDTASVRLNQPIVGMAVTADGGGYWLVTSDGGVFAFGDAQSFGSTAGLRLNRPIVCMTSTLSGRGYWLVASDGAVSPFGDAQYFGSTAGLRLNQPIVGLTATPTGRGYWLVASDGAVLPFGDAPELGGLGGVRLNQPIIMMSAVPEHLDSVFGQAVTFTITVSPSCRPGNQGNAAGPSGMVDIRVDGVPREAVPLNSLGQAVTPPFTFVSGSQHTIVASYQGDGSVFDSSSGSFLQTVVTTTLEPDLLDPSQFDLAVGGPSETRLIDVSTAGAGKWVQVQVGSSSDSRPTFAVDSLDRLLLFGGTGHQTLQVDDSVTVPTLLFAGNGGDLLKGGGGATVLVGGAGADTLLGGTGRSILIGGGGSDILLSRGESILIGGTTDYDSHLPALEKLLLGWSRTDEGYTARIASLSGPGPNGHSAVDGPDGAIFLNASTVHDDGVTDLLVGSPRMDWWFNVASGPDQDNLFNLRKDETVTLIPPTSPNLP